MSRGFLNGIFEERKQVRNTNQFQSTDVTVIRRISIIELTGHAVVLAILQVVESRTGPLCDLIREKQQRR